MEKIAFNVDSYTARLIGRENVSTLDGGLLELIKNSYDANAKLCVIYFEKSTKTLYILDNGFGMSKEVIKNNWMTIGNSSKRNNFKIDNRIQTGAKGIGRFALDRIASKCNMITIEKKSSFQWIVDWDSFKEGINITETYAEISEINPDFRLITYNIKNKNVLNLISEFKFDTGTFFKLEGLRDNWNEELIRKLYVKLAQAVPPENEKGFNLFFFTEESNKKESKITSKLVDSYDYKISFKVDTNGLAEIKIHRNEFDFRGKINYIKEKSSFNKNDFDYFEGKNILYKQNITDILGSVDKTLINNLGEFYGELFFYKKTMTQRDKDKFYYKDFSDRQKLNDKFGGIKIYRDNFRVKPYGEYPSSNFDWLLLDNRKQKSPASPTHPTGAWRVNSESILGQIYISRLNINLVDQANREGIIETREFILFKQLITSFIKYFEQDRQYVLKKLDELYFIENEAEKHENEIKEKAKEIHKQQENKNSVKVLNLKTEDNFIEVQKAIAVIEKKDKEIKDLEDENRMLRVLATTGIVVNTYMHEMKTVTQDLGMDLKLLGNALQSNQYEKAEEILIRAKENRNQFNEWFKVTLESVRNDRRTMRNHSIYEIISSLFDAWKNALSKKKITLEIDGDTDIEFKCFPYEIESIINNLLANSISAYESGTNKNGLKINVRLGEEDEKYVIAYCDDGPGLSKKYKQSPYKILEPLETDKRDETGEITGTGMGMWIIDKTMSDYNGEINLDKNINSVMGFMIDLKFNKRRRREKNDNRNS